MQKVCRLGAMASNIRLSIAKAQLEIQFFCNENCAHFILFVVKRYRKQLGKFSLFHFFKCISFEQKLSDNEQFRRQDESLNSCFSTLLYSGINREAG